MANNIENPEREVNDLSLDDILGIKKFKNLADKIGDENLPPAEIDKGELKNEIEKILKKLQKSKDPGVAEFLVTLSEMSTKSALGGSRGGKTMAEIIMGILIGDENELEIEADRPIQEPEEDRAAKDLQKEQVPRPEETENESEVIPPEETSLSKALKVFEKNKDEKGFWSLLNKLEKSRKVYGFKDGKIQYANIKFDRRSEGGKTKISAKLIIYGENGETEEKPIGMDKIKYKEYKKTDEKVPVSETYFRDNEGKIHKGLFEEENGKIKFDGVEGDFDKKDLRIYENEGKVLYCLAQKPRPRGAFELTMDTDEEKIEEDLEVHNRLDPLPSEPSAPQESSDFVEPFLPPPTIFPETPDSTRRNQAPEEQLAKPEQEEGNEDESLSDKTGEESGSSERGPEDFLLEENEEVAEALPVESADGSESVVRVAEESESTGTAAEKIKEAIKGIIKSPILRIVVGGGVTVASVVGLGPWGIPFALAGLGLAGEGAIRTIMRVIKEERKIREAEEAEEDSKKLPRRMGEVLSLAKGKKISIESLERRGTEELQKNLEEVSENLIKLVGHKIECSKCNYRFVVEEDYIKDSNPCICPSCEDIKNNLCAELKETKKFIKEEIEKRPVKKNKNEASKKRKEKAQHEDTSRETDSGSRIRRSYSGSDDGFPAEGEKDDGSGKEGQRTMTPEQLLSFFQRELEKINNDLFTLDEEETKRLEKKKEAVEKEIKKLKEIIKSQGAQEKKDNPLE